MSGEPDWRDYFDDLIGAVEHVVMQTSDASDSQILDKRGTLYGDTLHQLTVMGEAVKHLPAELTDAHPEVDWSAISGMRDKIVHGYFGIVREAVLSTVRDDAPSDLRKLRAILAGVEAEAG